MKTFICLFAMMSACNATLLSLLGGSGGNGNGNSGSASSGGSKITYNVVATPTTNGHGDDHGSGHAYSAGGSHGQSHGHSYAHDYGYGGGQEQIIKVILADNQGYSNDHSYGHDHNHGGYSHGNGYAYSNAQDSGNYDTQIFKVIEQQSAPTHDTSAHSYSGGGQGYAASYSYSADGHDHSLGHDHHHSYSHNHGQESSGQSQLNAILPQILQLVLQEDSRSGGGGAADGAVNSQLIDAYGLKGKAIVMRAEGKAGGFIQGGHVVQRGTLKVMRIENSGSNGGANGKTQSVGGSNHGWMSAPVSSGWNSGHTQGGWAAKPSSGGW